MQDLGNRRLRFAQRASGDIDIQMDIIPISQITRPAAIVEDMHDLSIRYGIDVDPKAIPKTRNERLSQRFFEVAGVALTMLR